MKNTVTEKQKMELFLMIILGIIGMINIVGAIGQYFYHHSMEGIFIAILMATPCIISIWYIHKKGLPLSKGYHMELDFQELWTLLFLKKQCIYCNARLKRIVKSSFEGERFLEHGRYISYGKQYNVKYEYECENCHKKISLKELAKNKRNK